jgi:hypothetical protein
LLPIPGFYFPKKGRKHNPSCHLQNTGQALEVVGKDEAPDFEHKALEGGGMYALGE